MTIILDSVCIKGLRHTHFEQLLELVIENERCGSYYGNKEQYMKRHNEIKEWLNNIIEIAKDSDYRIPK